MTYPDTRASTSKKPTKATKPVKYTRHIRAKSAEHKPRRLKRITVPSSEDNSYNNTGYHTPLEDLPTPMADMTDGNLGLRKFSGTTDVKEWKKRFEIVAKAKGLDEKKQAAWIPVFLTGPAMAFYDGLTEQVKSKLDECLKALVDQFSDLENSGRKTYSAGHRAKRQAREGPL